MTVYRTERGRQGDPEDVMMAHALRLWLEVHDPRTPLGCVVIAVYDDGASVQFLGSEPWTAEEVEECVLATAALIRKNRSFESRMEK